MNILSIESLLAELDKYKRAYESADRQILSLKEQRNRLTDERDGFGKAYHDAYMKTLELTAERDELKKECDIQRNLRIGVEAVFDVLNEDIGRLKAEVDYWKTIRQENAEYFEKRETELIKERDAALAENSAYYQLAKKEVWAVAESALREAKEALTPYMKFVDGTQVKNHPAKVYERINKVLGEE